MTATTPTAGRILVTPAIALNFHDARQVLCDTEAVRSYGEARDILNLAREKGYATCAGLTIHFSGEKFVIVP